MTITTVPNGYHTVTPWLINADTAGLIDFVLDVFEGEPAVNPALVELGNTVLTPHIGSAGTATRERMCHLSVSNVAAVLDGREPLTPVNLHPGAAADG